MVIRASAAHEIERLIADLGSADDVRRDTAVARLTVIGARALERLLQVAEDVALSARLRAAALRTLEGIPDSRRFEAALHAMDDPAEGVAVSAVGVARTFLASPRSLEVVDALTRVVLDPLRAVPVRLAAIDALRDLDSRTVEPLLSRISSDPLPEIAAAATQHQRLLGSAPHTIDWSAVSGGLLPPNADVLRLAIVAHGDTLPLATLHTLVNRIREREGAVSAEQRMAWTVARAAAHVALARRGSRLALYDLRESFETADAPLPVEFLTALVEIGDVSCLEPLAAAYVRASGNAAADWWRCRVADAFRELRARERMTRRHAIMRKIEKRWGPEVESLLRN